MATNLQIDDTLIHKAVKLGGHKTKKAAVTKALVEPIFRKIFVKANDCKPLPIQFL